ncbi:diguanylate cyclase domain-containing protein [Chitinibacter sp. S2-10]|uniref:diguanylate cyclase domain-containing protein n=1 Tax=Chitinibacter sp. S2-10 TaxID=3373597 RepID=UPI003977B50E
MPNPAHTDASVVQPIDASLQRHLARVKHERREQRQQLAVALGFLSLLAALLQHLIALPAWQSYLLPALAAGLFFAAALRSHTPRWEKILMLLAALLPPLMALLWAWAMRGQLAASALVLPFVLQPMLLLLAGLPLPRYAQAVAFNFVVIALLILQTASGLLNSALPLLVVLIACLLGWHTEYRLLNSQQRMWLMRQRVAENSEKMAERSQKIEKLAFEDPLTGLSNRVNLINQLRQILKNPHTEAISTVVFLIDLDHFKTVNDEYGHAAGDALLIEIAQRFKALVRRDDLVCRLGGDEFVILVRGLQGPPQIDVVAKKILAKLGEPVMYQEQRLPLGGSIGVAPWFPDLRSPASWLKAADDAMYKAKTGGRNRYVIADYSLPGAAPQ